jgi:hypothetical protein
MNLNVGDKAHVNVRKNASGGVCSYAKIKNIVNGEFTVFSKCICNFMISYVSLE